LAEWTPAGGSEDAVSIAEAEDFVGELLDSQILVSSLSPAITGPEPIHDLIDQLDEHAVTRPVSRCLEGVRTALEDLDAAGLGAESDRYRGVARRLEDLPTEVELPRLFQVDMDKPAAGATLGPEVLAEIRRGIDVLKRLAGPSRGGPLERFRQEFVERYGDSRTVPLVEVLDEELGIGFEGARGSESAPLLEALPLAPPPGETTVSWGASARLLLGKLEEAMTAGAREIELTEKELAPFGPEVAEPLPDAFQVVATLAAVSSEALARGEFRLAFNGLCGPSGARFLGRFCHADETLRQAVEQHLRQEEALEPDALFAEVVHLPRGRLGNVLLRPLLRGHEIPFLGRSGAREERQIPITDLLVTVIGESIVLSSRNLRCRVIPRLTSAHNYLGPGSLGIYHFFGALQAHGVRQGLNWSWGPFEGLSFLPRVTSGRLVLSRARWRVVAQEIEELVRGDVTQRFHAVGRWRFRRRLPRFVMLLDGDNELLVDLDNVLSIDAFLALVRKRPALTLAELFPGPEELCVSGPEGRFVHELVIPFVRRRAVVPQPVPPISQAAARRRFPPGSEWLYAKLYTGTSTADQVLREVVGPVVRGALAGGAADRWFFIRYSDPQWHLRLRLHGEPRRLHREVLPWLQQTVAPWLDSGRIWRLQLDTYEREVERYGGTEGIALAERLAHADSEAVLAIVESLAGDEGAAQRWRLGLCGLDLLLSDLGLESGAKLDLLHRIRESYAREFRAGAGLRKQLADRLRQERSVLEAMLDPGYGADHPLAPGLAALARRSRQLVPIVAELKSREAAQRLTVPLTRLVSSYLHMFVNRLIRSQGRAHELVLYDFLYHLTRSRQARSRQLAHRRPPRRSEPSRRRAAV
jgi:class I lanthipeptide synthase